MIDCADYLPKVFDEVIVPTAVYEELYRAGAPAKVKNWLAIRKAWLTVRDVQNPLPIAGLHAGETEALQLALECHIGAVLLDDLDARHTARRLGLAVVGTVGFLELSDERELIQLPEAIKKLRCTNFFISDRVLDEALLRHKRRKGIS
jgi:predicted nucleic acid-binding protein